MPVRAPADAGGRLPSLDGVRGLLALVVMVAHFAAVAGFPQLLVLARSAVNGFFLISAYALTISWRGRYEVFLVRRFIRLWPPYAAAMAAGVWLTGLPAPWGDYFWIPYRASDSSFPQDPVVWSLYTEVYASAAMPLFVWATLKNSTTVALALVIGALALLHSDFGYALWFVLGAWAARRGRIDLGWLNASLPQALGRISYSLYLTHGAVIVTCKHFAPGVWLWISLPLALAIATAFYMAIEAPSIEASRRAARWLSSRPALSRRWAAGA